MTDDLEMLWNEAVTLIEVLSQDLSEGTKERNEQPQ
jgi:hypothetical protein